MQSTSSASHRKVVGAAPARAADHATATPAPALPDLRAARRVLARSKFNRDLHDLGELARELRDKLEAFLTDHDYGSVAREPITAGLIRPAQVCHADVELRDATRILPEDVGGYLWATKVFVSVAETHAVPLGSEHSPDDTPPCAVIGGKGGA